MNIYETITHFEPITKGWSCDKKYKVTTQDGTNYLLRVTPADKSDSRRALFEMLQQVEKLGISMCNPIEFGLCDEGVYTLLTWIDGQDAEDLVPLLSETKQYVLGLKAGEILRKIHSIPAPKEQEDWATRFNRKTNIKIQKYRECELRFDGDDKVIEYIENNRHLLENRPQCFQHGDYHIGNMMIENSKLFIIDFDRFDFGDPWEEFNRIVWCAQSAPYFATGIIDGYFDINPPILFWQLLAFYIGSNTLSSIYWAIPFGQSEIDTMMKQSQDVLAWYDNMLNPVPSWYMANIKNIFEIENSIAPCGLVCKLCHYADSCNGCKSDNNCCGLRKTDDGCYQYNCCKQKEIDGCWQCEIAPCDKGMFSEKKDIRLRAFISYIKQNGKDKLADRLYHNAQNGIHYGHGKDYDNLGSVQAVFERIEEKW